MLVSVPFAPVFKAPDFMSEQVDEVLYGDNAEILEETRAFYRIKTDYGYKGWVSKDAFFKKLFEPDYIVTSPFADLLFQGRYKLRPAFTLPRGSRIKAEISPNNSRYAYVTYVNGQTYYINKSHISPISHKPDRESIISVAKSYLGVQYRWGGRTPLGIDCSGLCFNAYRFCGIDIWRDACIDKSPNLKEIPFDDLKKGDLLFFKGHVAMWLGDGKIIHSSASKGGVVIENYNDIQYLKEIYICAGTPF